MVEYKEQILEQIKEFEKQGWGCDKLANVMDSILSSPGGVSYRSYDLMFEECPICALYLEDNPDVEETVCDHSEEDLEEIRQGKTLASLLSELQRIELGEQFQLS